MFQGILCYKTTHIAEDIVTNVNKLNKTSFRLSWMVLNVLHLFYVCLNVPNKIQAIWNVLQRTNGRGQLSRAIDASGVLTGFAELEQYARPWLFRSIAMYQHYMLDLLHIMRDTR